jgi:hypothetical protein
LPEFRIGSDWRFSVKAIEQWQRGQETGAVCLPVFKFVTNMAIAHKTPRVFAPQ